MGPTRETAATGSRHGRARVGCSGWEYKDWAGLVYPPGIPRRRWFEHYTSLFDTVEINNTFYRLPPVTTVERWAELAPPGFTYAVKVGGFVSHRKKLKQPELWLPNHLDRVERLGEHLGPNLLQLPPRWQRNTERLDEFLHAAPQHLQWAVELRDQSWVHDETFEVLERHGAALCLHDLLPAHPWVRTADFTYVRFHGPSAIETPYQGRYTGRRLSSVAARLAAWMEEGADVWAFFNNDWDAHAVHDATWLRRRLDSLTGVTATPATADPG